MMAVCQSPSKNHDSKLISLQNITVFFPYLPGRSLGHSQEMLMQMTGWLRKYLQKSVVQILIPCSWPEKNKIIFWNMWKRWHHTNRRKPLCSLHLKAVWVSCIHINDWTIDRRGNINAYCFQDKGWWLFTQYTYNLKLKLSRAKVFMGS